MNLKIFCVLSIWRSIKLNKTASFKQNLPIFSCFSPYNLSGLTFLMGIHTDKEVDPKTQLQRPAFNSTQISKLFFLVNDIKYVLISIIFKLPFHEKIW